MLGVRLEAHLSIGMLRKDKLAPMSFIKRRAARVGRTTAICVSLCGKTLPHLPGSRDIPRGCPRPGTRLGSPESRLPGLIQRDEVPTSKHLIQVHKTSVPACALYVSAITHQKVFESVGEKVKAGQRAHFRLPLPKALQACILSSLLGEGDNVVVALGSCVLGPRNSRKPKTEQRGELLAQYNRPIRDEKI